jgi:putative copper resistance protein D
VTFGVLDIVLVLALLAWPWRNARAHTARHWIAWYAGALIAAITVFGHLGGDPRTTFLATAIQFTLLFFFAPVLLALGSPGNLSGGRLLGLIGPVLACVVTLVWFLTPWLRVELSHGWLWQVGHLIALAAGAAFCVPAVKAAGQDTGAYPVLLLVAFLELLLDAIPGIVVTIRKDILAPQVFLPHHTHAAAHTSQVHGGELLWVIAELLDIPFLAALVIQWVRADARHAAVVDARLDAHIPHDEQGGEPALQRPWWETDASVFGERAKDFRRSD